MPDRLHTVGETRFEGSLESRLHGAAGKGCRLYWLGQAGFVIEIGGYRLVVDPYLSDSLATKYRGGRFPHERLMPPPIAPERLGAVDLVLATHAHTDHMDPDTLRPLLAANASARLVAPAAEAAKARERSGLDAARMLLMTGGQSIEPLPDLRIAATPAAHTALETDEQDRNRFLGYAIRAGGVTIWHSGDCVPFDGLVEAVRPLRPDLVLLPVNGRDAELERNGFAGNFSLDEAIGLAADIGAPAMIAHHHGMFAFNSCDPERIDRAAAQEPRLAVMRARTGVCWDVAIDKGDGSKH
jgi:L-ascorbate metabolism protein UlaG (beta-lactamase superfamily)